MSKSMTLNVRVSGPLREFVAEKIGDSGRYENVSEYVRDLIRRDQEKAEREAFDRLKAELQRGFEAPDSAFVEVDREELLARNLRRHKA